MKKFILLALVAAGFGFTSCSKCKTCESASFPDLEICQDQYDTKEQYNAAVAVSEAAGYKCK